MIKGKTRVMVIDDEASILRYLGATLRKKDFEVTTASDGEEGLRLAEETNPSLVILDIVMPKMDGFEVCRRLREWTEVPIIMLSARGDEVDKVKCLDLGADDYITKPFGTDELMARVKAVLRRSEFSTETVGQPVTNGDLKIDFSSRLVTLKGKEVELTSTEYNLLLELILNSGKVLTHTHLLQKIWGPEYAEEKVYLHEYIHRLRRKIEPDKDSPPLIDAIRGVGYRFHHSSVSSS
jgi:two-component system, OmpR family, KDP operon response regulator KdpE